jgi:signal transduction histidine kinase
MKITSAFVRLIRSLRLSKKKSVQGTRLVLSLSYDIVKAHGGELKVETKEGEFTEFVIQLPLAV